MQSLLLKFKTDIEVKQWDNTLRFIFFINVQMKKKILTSELKAFPDSVADYNKQTDIIISNVIIITS